MNDQYNWNENENIAVPGQATIAVYHNPAGCIVIRAATDDPHEDDPFVVIRPEHLKALMAALRRVGKEVGAKL